MMLPQRRVPRPEQFDIVGPLHEADVRHGVDEVGRGPGHAAIDSVGPELLGVLELLEARQGPADLHAAVGLAGGRVAEFTQAGVAGAGVVPAVGAFLGELVRDLVHLEGELGLEALEQGGEVGGHDAAADQDDIGRLPQRVAQRGMPRVGIDADFALGDDTTGTGVHKLDRVFDGDNVAAAIGIAVP